jgi:hypothetical protein
MAYTNKNNFGGVYATWTSIGFTWAITYTNKNTFGSVYDTWDSIDFTWGDVISDIQEIIGGARNPEELLNDPYNSVQKEQLLYDYQHNNPKKKRRLIQIYVKCLQKKFNKTIELPDKNIFIKVNDVKFIFDKLKNVGVDVTNIKKYNNHELHNLLR